MAADVNVRYLQYLFLRELLQFALWTGYSQFEGNLRKTGLPAPLQVLEVHSQEAPCVSVG